MDINKINSLSQNELNSIIILKHQQDIHNFIFLI